MRFFAVVALLLVSLPAQAYLDPGTGSLLVQGLLAAIAGGLVFIRAKWVSLKDWLGRFRGNGRQKP
jgi:hypothetical protein